MNSNRKKKVKVAFRVVPKRKASVRTQAESEAEGYASNKACSGKTDDEQTEKLIAELKEYLASHAEIVARKYGEDGYAEREPVILTDSEVDELNDYLAEHRPEKQFAETAMEFMKVKKLTSGQVCARGGLSRQDYSRTMATLEGKRVRPKKATVWNYVIGLMLDIGEADVLMHSAGYSVDTGKFDTVMKFSLLKGIYVLEKINQLLLTAELTPLSNNYVPTKDKNK